MCCLLYTSLDTENIAHSRQRSREIEESKRTAAAVGRRRRSLWEWVFAERLQGGDIPVYPSLRGISSPVSILAASVPRSIKSIFVITPMVRTPRGSTRRASWRASDVDISKKKNNRYRKAKKERERKQKKRYTTRRTERVATEKKKNTESSRYRLRMLVKKE